MSATERAGDRDVDTAAGQSGGQAPELGLINQVAVDPVPVVIGSGGPFLATGDLAERSLFEDLATIVQGDHVTHFVSDVTG